MSIRSDLTNLGVAGPLAAELDKQITASTGNARRLMELGFIASHVLAAGITAENVDVARLAELGTPTEVAKYLGKKINPSFNWQSVTFTAGTDGSQWVGYSDGGASRPQPAFGTLSGQPTSVTNLLAIYDDTNSGNYIVVFAGDYLARMGSLGMTIGGTRYTPFNANIVGGNTWIRYTGSGDWVDETAYTVLFG